MQNKNPMPSAIITDLDGTLLRSDKTVSGYTVSIFEKCRQRGIKIIIATARSEKSAERITRLIKPDIMIYNGGSLVKNKANEIIYEKYISTEDSDTLLDDFKNNKNIGVVTIETINNYYVTYKDVSWHSDYMHGIYYDFSKPLSEKTYKITVEIHEKEIANKIKDKLKNIKVIEFAGENWYGFYPNDASKYLAIEEISKKENLKLDEIAAFGDDYNDIEMIEKCGTGVAVENGIDELKKAADYICQSNNKDGVAEWIEMNISEVLL